MGRSYDSTRRKTVAAETRLEILQAALKLHWEGITEFEQVAREAGCSLATVRKYFPTKEALYSNCTQAFAETLTLPDLEVLAVIEHRAERLRRCVYELCRMHESMFGYAWLAANERQNSPTLDAVMGDYERLADGLALMIAPARSQKASVVRGLLDFLTYRALRLAGGLSPDQVRDELVVIIRTLVGAET
jgi:AcrR family transcriptional regulator